MILSEQREIGQEARPPDKYVVQIRQREHAIRLLSDENLGAFLSQRDAAQWRWVQRNRGDAPALLDSLAGKLEVAPVPDSTLIEVRFTCDDGEAAAEIVNKLMEFYAERTRVEALRQIEQDRRVVNSELHKVQFGLARVHTRLQDLRQSPDFENMERARVEVIDRVAQLGMLETQARLLEEQTKRVAEAVNARYAEPEAPPSAEVTRAVETNAALLQMLARRQALLEELARLRDRGLTDDHPEVREANTRLRLVDDAIRAKRAELTAQAKEAEIKQAQAVYEAAIAQRKTIEANLTEARASKGKLEGMWVEYGALQRERDLLEQQQLPLQERMREMDMRITRSMPSVEVFARASPPRPAARTGPPPPATQVH